MYFSHDNKKRSPSSRRYFKYSKGGMAQVEPFMYHCASNKLSLFFQSHHQFAPSHCSCLCKEKNQSRYREITFIAACNK